MVQINYGQQTKEAQAPFLLLSGQTGAYFMHAPLGKLSRYEGFYTPIVTDDGWDLVKSFDSIHLDESVQKISYHPTHPIVHYDKATVQYELEKEGLIITIEKYKGKATLTLDVHPMHDYSDHDRIYECKQEKNHLIIFYPKANHTIAIKTNASYHLTKHWRQENYSWDRSRNSFPDQLYVFDAIEFDITDKTTIKIATGATKQQAIKNIQAPSEPKKVSYTPLALAKHSLGKLLVTQQKQPGIYAGLPWFFQWWTRDEAISLYALHKIGHSRQAKKILLRQILLTKPDGRLSNRFPESKLGSADGIGWCATRIIDLINDKVSFTKKELEDMFLILLKQKNKLEKHYLKDSLIHNTPFETWIDTGNEQDKRDGACLEIQLLQQKIENCLGLLAKKLGKSYTAHNRLHLIKELFFDGEQLADRIAPDGQIDNVQRPNIWLAYYLFPNLLHKQEWERAADANLEKTWLDWGGVSSIAKDHHLFRDTYTGQTNESYHRGDSWYFLNNLAAYCLKQINPVKYKSYIDKIYEASSYEIMYSGALGHHAEVSSAKQLESQGCLQQAWSMAMFIEAFSDEN